MEMLCLTDAKTKADWLGTWNEKAQYLFRAYQCKADPQLYDRLEFAIKAVIVSIEDIGYRMEEEGVWDKTSYQGIMRAYKEAKNCGYNGSMLEYCLSVGVTLEDLE